MTIAYNLNIPAATHNPSVDQPDMQVNTNAINQIWGIDHYTFGAGADTPAGMHQAIHFPLATAQVAPGTSPAILFTDTVKGIQQIKFYSGNAAHSTDQYLIGSAVGDEGSTFLFGGIIIKWGDTSAKDGGKTVTFAKPFPNQCFVVLLTSRDQAFTGQLSVANRSVNGFSAFRNSGTGSTGISFIAIGC